MSDSVDSSGGPDEAIYVSYNGSGRGVGLRSAVERAHRREQGLVYLAIFDPPGVEDDAKMAGLAVVELGWLLESQVRLVNESRREPVPVRVLVHTGDVVEEVRLVAEANAADLILVGGPLAPPGHSSTAETVAAVAAATDVETEAVAVTAEPGDS